jgi:hypothetical protein
MSVNGGASTKAAVSSGGDHLWSAAAGFVDLDNAQTRLER